VARDVFAGPRESLDARQRQAEMHRKMVEPESAKQ
jgi:hypothetical protein